MTRVLLLLATAGLIQAQSADPWRALMERVLSNLEQADSRLSDYAYLRYNVRREFDSDGGLKQEHTFLARRDFLEGWGWIRQIERDGEPVPAAELANSEAALRARIAEFESMTPAEQRAANAKNRREREEETAWLKEFPQALDYRKTGERTVDGRTVIVLAFSPRPGFKPSNMRARVFEKVRGIAWIDKAEEELVHVDAEVFETVNIGWGVLGKIHEGTRFSLDRRRLEDGNWLPRDQTVRYSARLLLFKTLAQEEITRYSAYEHKSVAMSGSQRAAP